MQEKKRDNKVDPHEIHRNNDTGKPKPEKIPEAEPDESNPINPKETPPTKP